MLTASRRQYERQQRITALGVTQIQRVATHGARVVSRALAPYQAASIALSLEMAPEILAEQGIDSTATARVIGTSMLSGPRAADLIEQAQTDVAFLRLVQSLIQDSGRTASVVSNTVRPAVTGYVRYLNAPSCGRCAVLAGRVYRYSQGFQRHPRCDCQMHPTDMQVGPELTTDPIKAFERGEIRGLSKGDVVALENGADLDQVVNVRSKAAGLTVGSSVITRGTNRLTPQGVLTVATDRAQQVALLRLHGYIT